MKPIFLAIGFLSMILSICQAAPSLKKSLSKFKSTKRVMCRIVGGKTEDGKWLVLNTLSRWWDNTRKFFFGDNGIFHHIIYDTRKHAAKPDEKYIEDENRVNLPAPQDNSHTALGSECKAQICDADSNHNGKAVGENDDSVATKKQCCVNRKTVDESCPPSEDGTQLDVPDGVKDAGKCKTRCRKGCAVCGKCLLYVAAGACGIACSCLGGVCRCLCSDEFHHCLLCTFCCCCYCLSICS